MKIAVEGCAHGEIEKIYDTIEALQTEHKFKVDLLICCGDFQASRNLNDVECMAVPDKFKDICTFYKYYSGEKIAPVLTLIIGGNHEASNYFQELAYGGWVAPNMYYLGHAGVVNVANIRIAGLSGIYKPKDYNRGRFETTPYTGDSLRSLYHIRALDVFRLKQMTKNLDIMLTHDWPKNIHKHGDVKALLKRKPFFQKDIESNCLGSEPAAEILETIKPSHWFSAHLHVKFPALVKHSDGSKTKFLALDKCLPRRRFLQVVDVPHDGEIKLSYDEEWLAILQLTNHLVSVRSINSFLPGPSSSERWSFTPTESEKNEVRKRFNEDFVIPSNFTRTAAPYEPNQNVGPPRQPQLLPNPQTTEFCKRLGVDDPLALLLQKSPGFADNSLNESLNDYSSFQLSDDLDEGDSSPEKVSNFRTPLQLPPPVSFSSPISTVETTPKPLLISPVVNEEQNNDKTASVKRGDDSETSTLGPKPFKRRNLSIYASTENS